MIAMSEKNLKIFKVIGSSLIGLITAMGLLFCANKYIIGTNPINIAIFILLFILLPIGFVFVFRKNREIKWVVFVLAIFVSISSIYIGYGNFIIIKKDFKEYMSKDTDFNQIAATKLPNKSDLNDSQVVFYEEAERLNGTFHVLRMVVEYSTEEYFERSEALSEYQDMNQIDQEIFYLNGTKYYGYVFNVQEYYAIAYHCCSDDLTISYIFVCGIDLQSASMGATLFLHERFFGWNVIYG